jgi:tetratricopeptide (TPR) repeat protein
LALNERHLRRTPDDPHVERELAANLSDLSVLLDRFNRPIDALSLDRSYLGHHRRQVARYPDRLLYQQDLLVGLNNVAVGEWYHGNKDQALARLGEALALSRELTTAHPDITSFSMTRFRFAAIIGRRRKERGEPHDEADDEALPAFPTAVSPEEGVRSWELSMFSTVADRRIGSLLKGQFAASAAERSRIDKLRDRAVPTLAATADAGSMTLAQVKNPTLWPNLRDSADFRALVRRLEEGKPAVVPKAANLMAATHAPAVPTRRELDIRARSERADTQFATAVVMVDLGQMDEAGRTLDQARAEFESLVRDDPKSPDHRFDLSRACVLRANLANGAGRRPEAFQGWIAGRDLELGVAADPASDPTTAATCRAALLDLGQVFCDRGLWAEADRALEPALALKRRSWSARQGRSKRRVFHGNNSRAPP